MEIETSFFRVIAKFFFISLVFSFSPNVVLAEDEVEQVPPFDFNGNCLQLFELTDQELADVAHRINRENFNEFCFPEWPDRCEDYAALMSDWGILETSRESDVFCEFTPHESLKEGPHIVR